MIENQCEKCGVYYEDGERHHCGPMFLVREAGSQKAVQVFAEDSRGAVTDFVARSECSITQGDKVKERLATVEVLEHGAWVSFRVFACEVTEYIVNRI